MSRKNRFRAMLAALNAVMFTCHDMTALISQSQDANLSGLTRWRMKLHFVLCVWCRRYQRQLRFLRRALLVLPENELGLSDQRLPMDAKARLKEALKNDQEKYRQPE
jgi:hypothetical protein